VVLLIALALLSVGGTLVGDRLREAAPGLRAVALLLGLAETWRSPLYLAAGALLVANLTVCTWQRLRARLGRPGRRRLVALLDAAVHLSLVLVVAGGAARGAWGRVGTGYLFVGEEAGSMYEESVDRDVPLGFGVRLLERREDFYPLRLRVGVRTAGGGAKVAVLEPREGGGAVALADGSLAVEIRGFVTEPAAVDLLVRAGDDQRQERLSLVAGESAPLAAGPYELTALAWRRDVRSVRGLVQFTEDGRPAGEGWLEVNGSLTHRGTSLFLTAWGEEPPGRPFLGVQYRRDRSAPLFWIGAVLLAVALPPFVALRRR